MKIGMMKFALVLLFAAGSVVPGHADEAAPAGSDGKTSTAAPIPKDLQDPEFDKYVDLDQLRDAWREMDQVALAKIAAKLAEGERTLSRSHKVAKSRQILIAAARAAAKRGDKETLEMLEKVATQFSFGVEREVIASLLKSGLDSPSRAAPVVNINANEVSGSMLDAYHDMQGDIEAAAIAGDKESLDSIAKQLEENAEFWPQSLLAALNSTIESARGSQLEPIAEVELLDKLIDGTRAFKYWYIRNPDRFTKRMGRYWVRPLNPSIPGVDFEIRPRKTHLIRLHPSAGNSIRIELSATSSTLSSSWLFPPPGKYKIGRKLAAPFNPLTPSSTDFKFYLKSDN